MKKTISIGLCTILIIISTAFSFVGHYSTQITPGNFQSGYYNFPGIFSINTNKFFVNGTSGYVGIGTNQPTSIFTVVGDTNFTGNTTINGNINVKGNIEINNTPIQLRITGNCTVGNYISAINADGTVVCKEDSTGGATGTYYYPTDIKLTNTTHDGNFGGYAAMNDWIQTQNCSEFHVCESEEITSAIKNGITAPSNPIAWYNEGSYSFVYGTSIQVTDCNGWTNSATNVGGHVWRNYPGHSQCINSNPVMCCKWQNF